MNRLYLVGTFDTKADELNFAKSVAEGAGAEVVTVDVSTSGRSAVADVSAPEVASHHPEGAGAVLAHEDRGRAVSAMGAALAGYLASRDDVGAVLGMGGTGNTALVAEGMRALPVGVPKLILSTVASGNTAPYMGPTDMAMMASVVDIAGLNAVSRKVIANAARAAAGMALASAARSRADRPAVGMTMFGVTTDCVTAVRHVVEDRYDACVFHATGIGGQSMEKLVESGFLKAVIDLTTTEVADLLVGGVFAATEDRFGSIIRSRLPYVGSVGACDMVNFGARETVPAQFAERRLHVHNANVTLMRTTPEENARIGAFIVERLNRMEGPVRFLLPLRGVSAIDAPGLPFHDPDADAALFDAIRSGWRQAPNRKLIEVDANINDPSFAEAALDAFGEVVREEGNS